jgi:hypothetical protein
VNAELLSHDGGLTTPFVSVARMGVGVGVGVGDVVGVDAGVSVGVGIVTTRPES